MPDREGIEELLFCTAISRSLSGKQTREGLSDERKTNISFLIKEKKNGGGEGG